MATLDFDHARRRYQALQVPCDFSQGIHLLESGKPHEAVEEFKQLVEIYQNDPAAHYNLGIAWDEIDQVEKALACYERSLECDPTFAAARFNLALIYARYEDLGTAIRHMRLLVEQYPSDCEALLQLATIEEAEGLLDFALLRLRHLERNNPDFPSLYLFMANIEFKRKRYPDAIEHYKEALRRDKSLEGVPEKIRLAQELLESLQRYR